MQLPYQCSNRLAALVMAIREIEKEVESCTRTAMIRREGRSSSIETLNAQTALDEAAERLEAIAKEWRYVGI